MIVLAREVFLLDAGGLDSLLPVHVECPFCAKCIARESKTKVSQGCSIIGVWYNYTSLHSLFLPFLLQSPTLPEKYLLIIIPGLHILANYRLPFIAIFSVRSSCISLVGANHFLPSVSQSTSNFTFLSQLFLFLSLFPTRLQGPQRHES